MLKDKRDDFDENEDADLTGMIHQYNEDNELRRKINEMKKQKAENKQREAIDVEDDNIFIPSSKNNYEEERIPNIRADHDVEKTRVGFQDDSDKTLVIMDRKNKIEPEYQSENIEPSYTRNDLPVEEEEEDEEDLRETVRKKKKEQKNDNDNEELSEKDKKLNKTITYVIIGVLSLALLVGIGFGVKTIFFNGSSDEKNTDVDDKKKDTKETETTTKKKTPKKTEIKDNSAAIKQLEAQRTTYEEQLAQVQRDITSAQSEETAAQGSLDNITALFNDANALKSQITTIQTATGVTSLDALKTKMDEACKADEAGESCITLTDSYNQYDNLNRQYTLKQQQYDTENAKTNTYLNNKKAASDKVISLKQQQTDLEAKIADITTKLAKYDE